jgi:hypothetical protein
MSEWAFRIIHAASIEDADPELQPLVREARAARQRLGT